MPEFKVQLIKQIEQGGEGDKAWTRQKLRVETPDGVKDVLLWCPKWIPVPSEGDRLDVAEVKPPYREGQLPEIKLAKKSGGGGGPRVNIDDPETRVSIQKQVAYKTATELVLRAIELKQDPAEVARMVHETARAIIDAMGEK